MMSTGAISLSRALLRNEKHSMSSIWTSSINNTPGTISALPSSLHSATFPFICSLTSDLISPVSPKMSNHIISSLYVRLCQKTVTFHARHKDVIYSTVIISIPEKRARKPCVLEFITSISCSVTVCTTSFLFCNSPSGHCTNFVCEKTHKNAINYRNYLNWGQQCHAKFIPNVALYFYIFCSNNWA